MNRVSIIQGLKKNRQRRQGDTDTMTDDTNDTIVIKSLHAYRVRARYAINFHFNVSHVSYVS